MRDIFGNTGIIGSIDLLIASILVLGSFIFRKSVANDILGMPFSIIGSTAPSIILFIVFNNIFSTIKYPLIIAIGTFLLGGFLLGDLLGDGEANSQ